MREKCVRRQRPKTGQHTICQRYYRHIPKIADAIDFAVRAADYAETDWQRNRPIRPVRIGPLVILDKEVDNAT